MYLLKNKQPAYWIHTKDRATSTTHSDLKEAFIEFTLDNNIWDPSEEERTVVYKAEGISFTGYDAETNKRLDLNTYTIVAKLPDDCTYEQFATLHPELLI